SRPIGNERIVPSWQDIRRLLPYYSGPAPKLPYDVSQVVRTAMFEKHPEHNEPVWLVIMAGDQFGYDMIEKINNTHPEDNRWTSIIQLLAERSYGFDKLVPALKHAKKARALYVLEPALKNNLGSLVSTSVQVPESETCGICMDLPLGAI